MSTSRAEIERDLDRQGAPKLSLDEHRQPATPGTIAAIKAARSLLMRAQYDKITRLFPDTGENRRELYPRHLEVFRLGATTSERLFMAANRVGKSVLGAYEVTCHLTGWYPHWWEGKQFNGPTRVWCAGDTSQTVRDIVQKALLGPATSPGVGLIPKKYLRGQPRKKPGMPDAIETAWVRHSSGLDSQVTFKSYEQGRKSFQGTEIEFVWLDEEPPSDVYDECLTRTMTTDGLVLTTATPLSGLTPFILSFLPDGKLHE